MGGQSGSWTPTKRRGPIAAEFQGPGPAAITLPSLFGNINIKESNKARAPSYTFGSRPKTKLDSASPSPNSYNTSGLNPRGKDSPQGRTMAQKLRDPKIPPNPAPGQYEPTLLNNEPAYSFGIKPEEKRNFVSPAPGVYEVTQADVILNTTPSYSFGQKLSDEVPFTTPAPGSYEPKLSDCNPSYTFGHRCQDKADFVSPSPNAYEVTTSLDSMPKYTFGQKGKETKNFVTPSPLDYDPDLPNVKPAYTFGLRPGEKKEFVVPGPGTYRPEDCKDEAKAPTMHIKPKDPKNFVTPSPGAYNPENAERDVKPQAPRYSFGIKGRDGKIQDVPAPNAYSVPTIKELPSYSLASRAKEPKKYVTPAPGAYEASDVNNYKSKSPAFSLSTRYTVPSDHTQKPGPSAYLPEKADNLEHKPSYAFGLRHSPYLGALKGDAYVGTKTEHMGNAISRNNNSVRTNGTSSSSKVVENGSTSTTTRVHSDGHRIRTETFSYTKGPTTTTRVTSMNHYKTEQASIA